MTNNKTSKKLWIAAIVDLLIIAAVMTCLFTGFINPVVAAFAMLMPVWVVAALCLWCTVLLIRFRPPPCRGASSAASPCRPHSGRR